MSSAATINRPVALGPTRQRLADLFTPNLVVYWLDLLTSVVVGYGAALVFLNAPFLSLLQWLTLPVAAAALYRAASFIHEVAHQQSRRMRVFNICWDILVGIPLLMPSAFYRMHFEHHNGRFHNTAHDKERLYFTGYLLRDAFWYFSHFALVFAFLAFRFLILTPISFLHPRLRAWVRKEASSFALPSFRSDGSPPPPPDAFGAFIEIACCLRAWAMVALVATGVKPWTYLVAVFMLAFATFSMNFVRNLVDHHYAGRDKSMTFADQIAGSMTIAGGLVVTELFMPLGLRYHTLHHLFPKIPYHNLPAAHRRLWAELPADSVYRANTYPHMWAALRDLARIRRAGGAAPLTDPDYPSYAVADARHPLQEQQPS